MSVIFLSLSNCMHEVHLEYCPLCILLEFRKGNAPILVATDVASRGLGLSPFVFLVIRFISPDGIEHRHCIVHVNFIFCVMPGNQE